MSKWIIIVVGIIIVLGAVLIVVCGSEDTWIKDSRGVWVKHGNPKEKPAKVSSQEALIEKALAAYNQAKASGKDLSNGPCLDEISADWVADISHSPRQEIDNQPENQCQDFRTGKAHHFIEIDIDGKVIKVD